MYCIAKVDQVRKGPSCIFREAKGKVRMRLTRGIFLEMAILKDECAKPRIDYISQEKLCQLVFGESGYNVNSPRQCCTWTKRHQVP